MTIRREYPVTWTVRETGPSEHAIEGLLIPYDTPTEISDFMGVYRETVARGAVDPESVVGMPMLYRHGEPFALITRAWDSDRGLTVSARVSDTALGRDALVLARDGVVGGLSAGFDPLDDGQWAPDRSSVTWTSIAVREASITPFPAYKDARITVAREAPPMTEPTPTPPATSDERVATLVRERVTEAIRPTTDGLTELREQIAALTRELDRGQPQHTYTREGDFASDLWTAHRDPEARARLVRAIANVTAANSTGLLPQNVLSRVFGDISVGRPISSAIGIQPLPAVGVSVDVPTITTDPSTGDQSAWLGAITGTSPVVSFTNATVFTEAGGNAVPRQFIERTSPDGLALLTRRYAEIYARRYETRVVTLLNTATQTAAVATGAWTTANVAAALASAAGQIVTGIKQAPDIVALAPDLFFNIALVSGLGFPIAGGNAGNASMGSLGFEAFGLRFVCAPLLAAGSGFMLSRDAVMLLESPGAPFNISAPVPGTLETDFAVYGYGALVTNSLTGVVKLSKTA